VIKDNIQIHTGCKIDVCPGYHDQGRRCGKPIGRDIDPYVYIYTCIALA
jgi:hypothetical protein